MSLSCPNSCNDSSNLAQSFDSGGERADGDYGVPTCCFCGQFLRLELATTVENQGRKYYKCPLSEDGGEHLSKWWDDAVDEELKKLLFRLREQKESVQHAFRYRGGANPALESIRESMRQLHVEVSELKEQLLQKDGEIGRLREELDTRDMI